MVCLSAASLERLGYLEHLMEHLELETDAFAPTKAPGPWILVPSVIWPHVALARTAHFRLPERTNVVSLDVTSLSGDKAASSVALSTA
eukprot:4676159-Prymnesium_polylepis.1